MKKNIIIKTDEADKIPFEVLERAIVDIGQSISKLKKTRITDKLLIALIHDDSKIAKGVIEEVLKSFELLGAKYLKKV